MFNVDGLATIYIYTEYIIPIILIFIIVAYKIISHYFTKFKLYMLHRRHNIIELNNQTYWYTYKCKDCEKVIYKQPSGVNTSLNSTDYIFRYTGKCIKQPKE